MYSHWQKRTEEESKTFEHFVTMLCFLFGLIFFFFAFFCLFVFFLIVNSCQTSAFGFRMTRSFFMVVRTTNEWLIFFLLLCNRRRIGLTVFFMGAILYALFLAIFSHYLYCGHYFMANNSVVVNEFPRNNEVFEVSEMKNTCIIKLGYNTRNGCMPKISKPRTALGLTVEWPKETYAKKDF